MDREGFRRFLQGRDTPEGKIDQFIAVASRFEDFLRESPPRRPRTPTSGDVEAFSAALITDGLNTRDSFVALARYGQFLKNNEMYRAVVELIDGSEAMENLYNKLGESVGQQLRDKIFRGIELPPLGTLSSQKPRTTQALMERLDRMVDPETCKEILGGSLRDLEDEDYLELKRKYLETEDVDAFLRTRGEDFIALLEQCRTEGKLFFTQEVTDEVIEFVREHPAISQGVRDGNVIYEVKIPYMAKEYLAETDERMKRYHYCHCPWIRESIKTGDVDVSPTFCHCSAGFVKKPWEVILGQPLEAEVVESVLKGDMWCKIAIHLPEHLTEGAEAEPAKRV